jgi:hypothetical protein
VSKTQLVAGHTNDARASGLDHLDGRSIVQTELLQPVDVMGIAHDLPNFGRLSRRQTADWKQFTHGKIPNERGVFIESETASH